MSAMRLAKLLENAPLEGHTTFGVQQRARYLIEVNDLPELYEAVEFARDNHLELLVLGGGSNVLFVRDFPGLIVIIKLAGIVREGANKLCVAAGENWHDLVEWTLANHPLIRIWQRRSISNAAIATLPIGIVSSSERLEAGILCSK